MFARTLLSLLGKARGRIVIGDHDDALRGFLALPPGLSCHQRAAQSNRIVAQARSSASSNKNADHERQAAIDQRWCTDVRPMPPFGGPHCSKTDGTAIA